MSDELKNTPLYGKHVELGARMVPFGGWNMPVQYKEGILAEHKHTRELVSLFDICHMGEFRVKGPGAAEALDKLMAREVAGQKAGICRYNFLMTDSGTVIDDLIVYRESEEEFFIVVNAGTKDNDAEVIKAALPDGVSFADESAATAKLDLQGPKSADVLIENFAFKAEELPNYFNFIHTEINSIPCLLSRTGYTGELGFELYIAADKAEEVWQMLLDVELVKPAGLGARDTLRLEMGYPLYGHELNTETTPVEAGFGPMLKLDSSRTFTGSDALINGTPSKKLVGIELEGRRAAREGAGILINGEKVGTVSSGAFSPSLGKAVAMGFIASGSPSELGTVLELEAGRALIEGTIVELPFYKEGSVRKKL